MKYLIYLIYIFVLSLRSDDYYNAAIFLCITLCIKEGIKALVTIPNNPLTLFMIPIE